MISLSCMLVFRSSRRDSRSRSVDKGVRSQGPKEPRSQELGVMKCGVWGDVHPGFVIICVIYM